MEKTFLVCITDNWNFRVRPIGPMPKKNEIYIFDGKSDYDPRFIHLREFTWVDEIRVAFDPTCFRPVDYSVGERVCESIERQPVKQLA